MGSQCPSVTLPPSLPSLLTYWVPEHFLSVTSGVRRRRISQGYAVVWDCFSFFNNVIVLVAVKTHFASKELQ